ncbi:hypothetical protein Scep_004249 [Stephania cephalantha]|uniref:Uncharacterized protein n=1 Tax=Stephania cephalantha TaxID=152367 RepID=A0AAP0PWH8_9MAGN
MGTDVDPLSTPILTSNNSISPSSNLSLKTSPASLDSPSTLCWGLCRRCELSSRLPEVVPSAVSASEVVADCRRYLCSHRRLPSAFAAAACAAPVADRRCSSLRWKPSPFSSSSLLAVQVRCSPLFVTAVETIFVCPRPLPPLPMKPLPLFAAVRCYQTNTSETPPTVNELYLHLHTVNHDGVTFIDTRSERLYDKLQMRRLELTQATPEQPVDDEAVYLNVAGECPKGRVYGLGSLGRKKMRYADPGASTSQMPEMVPRAEFDIVAEQLQKDPYILCWDIRNTVGIVYKYCCIYFVKAPLSDCLLFCAVHFLSHLHWSILIYSVDLGGKVITISAEASTGVVLFGGGKLVTLDTISVLSFRFVPQQFQDKLQRRRQELTQTTPDQPVDDEAVYYKAKLQRRRQELTQTTPDQPVDDEAVYNKVAGECPKGRVYGLGSLGRKKS